MKKIMIVLFSLLTVFFCSWGYKARKPVNRPTNLAAGETIAWYEANYNSPTADAGWTLDETIPDNYIPVPGQEELYMVVDDSGKIIEYRTRTKDAVSGDWLWKTVNPDIPEGYIPVEGKKNVYKVTDAEGNESYVLYVRNDDDTYCFVPCDINGTPFDIGTDATVIDTGHYIKESSNTYSFYNDNGVFVGYRERQEVKDEAGNTTGYIWGMGNIPDFNDKLSQIVDDKTTTPPVTPGGTTAVAELSPTPVEIYVTPPSMNTKDNGDGTYTETKTVTETRTENGYQVTYETRIHNVYDIETNELLRTSQQGPYEVSRTRLTGTDATVDQSLIENDLSAEYARIAHNVTFDEKKAERMLADINALRTQNGLNTLIADETVITLAKVRAADMAIYNHSSQSSPMYGTLEDMVKRWNIEVRLGYENVLRTTVRDADAIISRFRGDAASSQNMLSPDATHIGIGVVEKDGQDFVAIIFFA